MLNIIYIYFNIYKHYVNCTWYMMCQRPTHTLMNTRTQTNTHAHLYLYSYAHINKMTITLLY